MNAPHLLLQKFEPPSRVPAAEPEGDELDLLACWHILLDNFWLVVLATVLSLALGAAYAWLAPPKYEAALLVQVEDAAAGAKGVLGEAGSLFEVKTPVTAEIEIFRSRMVVGRAVDALKLAGAASRDEAIDRVQASLKLAEKSRGSGLIQASLQDTDRERSAALLNEIAKQYVQQNVERKSAEAGRMLAFVERQLPQLQKQLEDAEEAYSNYRHRKGTVALDEEARMLLARSAELQGKRVEAQQRRRETVARFTPEHPQVRTLDEQIAAWSREIDTLEARVKAMPAVQQDTARLQRDVKASNELYQQLRASAMQLQLVREGKTGNVRVIDAAVAPRAAIAPKKPLVLLLALGTGLLAGVMLAFARTALQRGLRSPQEVELRTGLDVLGTLPLSAPQHALARKMEARAPGLHLLARHAPHDAAIESLHSLRSALAFKLLDARNNRVLVTSGTPGVGKSFVAINLAAVLADSGQRVLLVDCDLRRGHLHQYFGFARGRGVSELMARSAQAASAIRRDVLPGLDFLSTGALPPHPAQWLVGGACAAMLDALSPDYDVVLIDTAPILAAADTLSIAALAGTLLLVARADKTLPADLQECTRRLAQTGCQPAGVVFNALDLSRRHHGRYGYAAGYGYGAYGAAPVAARRGLSLGSEART